MHALTSASVGLALCLSGASALRTKTGKPYMHAGSYVPGSGVLPTVESTGDVPTWEWHSVAGTQCMDKKETGFWIREGNPKKLMVYLMGGGACFNTLCSTLATSNPLGFDAGPPMTGILRPNSEADDEKNPLGDHTAVFVPYCTGDVFFGNQDEETSFGLFSGGPRIFKGRTHLTKVMDSLTNSPLLSETVLDHFVLTGESAGGFGGLASYDFIRTTYVSDDGANTHFKIDKKNNGRAMLIDDSGIVMNKFHLTPCLTNYWVRLYNLKTTLPEGCPECAESLYNIYPFLQKKYADDILAFISSSEDEVITLFYGFGFTAEKNGECGNALLPGKAPTSFKEGIESFWLDYVIGEGGADSNNFASYFFPGSDHTHTTQDNFYFRTEVFNDFDGKEIKLVDWYQRIVDGVAVDVESSLFENLIGSNVTNVTRA